MLKKISIALFAVLFAAACGTADKEPVPDDVPDEENIAPDNQEEPDPRNEDGIDEGEMPENQPDVDMEEEPMGEDERDLDRDENERDNE